MGIPTESTIDTREIERTATLRLVRVVDFEALAEANGGSVTKEQIQTAGDYEVVVTPNGRDAKEIRRKVESLAEGNALINGFVLCAELKKRAPRKPNTNGAAKPVERMTKAELVAHAAKNKIDLGDAKSRPELLAAVSGAAN